MMTHVLMQSCRFVAGVSSRTDLIEELMSISDGQIVVHRAEGTSGDSIEINYRQSLSRMGTRAYYPAMQDLAPQVCTTDNFFTC